MRNPQAWGQVCKHMELKHVSKAVETHEQTSALVHHDAHGMDEVSTESIATEPRAIEDLVATSERERSNRKYLPLLGVWIAIQSILIAAFPSSPAVYVTYLFSVIAVIVVAARFSRQYRQSTRVLAQADDVRLVGPLIDRLGPGRKGRSVRRMVRQALTNLLPRLKASDASLLTARQKGRLVRHLAQLALFQRDKEFQIAILRALEQIGGAEALPVVEGMTHRTPRWADQVQVHDAAVECLQYLRQRASEEESHRTLLRSADRDVSDDRMLLHPAGGTPAADPDVLLRAAQDPQ